MEFSVSRTLIWNDSKVHYYTIRRLDRIISNEPILKAMYAAIDHAFNWICRVSFKCDPPVLS